MTNKIFSLIICLIFISSIFSYAASNTKHERRFNGKYLLEDIRLKKDRINSDIEIKKKVTYIYDSIQILQDTTFENIEITTMDGTLRPVINNQYFFSVKPQYNIVSRWNKENQEWVNTSVNKYSFDAKNKTKTTINMKWDSRKEEWTNNVKSIKRFDKNWDIISNKKYKYEKKTKEWIPTHTDITEYENHKLSQNISISYENGKVKKSLKSVYLRDSLGHNINEHCYSLKNDSNKWKLIYIEEKTYVNDNIATRINTKYTNDKITERIKTNREYDSNGKITSSKFEEYNFKKNRWEELYRPSPREYLEKAEKIRKGINDEDDW